MKVRGTYISPRYFCTLKYQQETTLGAGIGATGIQNFAGNGCWDPDITGTGFQPVGWDQIMAMYRYCTVHASTIAILVMNETDAFTKIMVLPSLSLTDNSDMYPAVPYVTTRYLRPFNTGSDASMVKIVKSMSSKKIWNVSTLKTTTAYANSGTANPTNIWYWKLMAENPTGLKSTGVRLSVLISYKCEMWNQNELDKS